MTRPFDPSVADSVLFAIRKMSIEVVPDNQAVIALKATHPGDAIQVEDGKFTIDAAKGADIDILLRVNAEESRAVGVSGL